MQSLRLEREGGRKGWQGMQVQTFKTYIVSPVLERHIGRKTGFFVFLQKRPTTHYILPFVFDCCPSVDPPLELALGAGKENAQGKRLIIPPTPSHSPTSTTTSTQRNSIAPTIYPRITPAQTPSRPSNAAAETPHGLRCEAAAHQSTVTCPWLFAGASGAGDIP
jgi:hypothetical protein